MADPARPLEGFARSGPAAPLFDRVLAAGAAPTDVGFRALFASVPRRLGAAARLAPAVPPELGALGRPHLTWTDWARAGLIERALGALPWADQPAALLRWFEGGELGEQQSVLRVLGLLPEPGRFVEIGLLGMRANARGVLEAIACENPYPAAHFSELYFNQMVMKAIFNDVSVTRIEGLAERRGPELLRMLDAYASERRAASRPVPDDVTRLLLGATP